MTKKYNNRGEEICNEGRGHEFENGVCVHCSAPETSADTDKAIASFYAEEDKRLAEQASQEEW